MSTSFERMWGELLSVGRASSGGYRRYAWTREDHTLREWFAGECARRGLDLTEDRVGNQWAWWGDPDAAVSAGRPGVAMGSHLDSVPDGGAYDGPLGVVTAFAVIDALRESGQQPAVPLAVVNFTDEEGARFGVACAGSRVLTGAMSAERALALTDTDGLSMAQALTAAGRDPSTVGADPEALRRVGSFVELHVEQGRALVDLGLAVGLASDIWPHGRWRVDLPGKPTTRAPPPCQTVAMRSSPWRKWRCAHATRRSSTAVWPRSAKHASSPAASTRSPPTSPPGWMPADRAAMRSAIRSARSWPT